MLPPTIALCRFLFMKLSIGKFNLFNLQVSFSLGLFISDTNFEVHFRCLLNIWVWVDCRPIRQQIYTRTNSSSIGKETGCNEYVEDQLKIARKNLAKYPLDEKDGNKYLEHICSMNGWSDLKFVKYFTRPDFRGQNFTQ